MAEGPIVAGAGAGTYQRKQQSFFRAPTDEEKEEIQYHLQALQSLFEGNNEANRRQILSDFGHFLDENPQIRINDVYTISEDGSTFYKDTLNFYGLLMLSNEIDTNNQFLKTVMKHYPDPIRISSGGMSIFDALKTEIEESDGNNDEATSQLFRQKLRLAEDYKNKLYAKNLISLTESGKNFFEQKKLSENVEGRLLEFITNETGSLPEQLRKYKAKVGAPGAQLGGRKGKKSRKARKSKSKSRNKSKRN